MGVLVGSSASSTDASASSQTTFSLTVTEPGLVLVFSRWGAGAGETISGVTVATTAATSATGSPWSGVGADRIAAYYHVVQTTGAKSIVVSHSTGCARVHGALGTYGNRGTTPIGTIASAQTSTVNVTAGSGWLIADCVSATSSQTAGADQTERWSKIAGTAWSGVSTEPGSAAATMSWSSGALIVAVPLAPAALGGIPVWMD